MSRSPFFLLIACYLLAPYQLWAQFNELNFKSESIDSGLSQSVVTAIIQDKRGFLWFGTQDGLNRYDGYHFVVYRGNAARKGSLSGSYIHSLARDSQGNIWVGTEQGGLNLYDTEGDRFITYPLSTGSNTRVLSDVVDILPKNATCIWVATDGQGLFRVNPETGEVKIYRATNDRPQGLLSNRISCLEIGPEGMLWIGTIDAGFTIFDPQTESFHQPSAYAPSFFGRIKINNLYLDRKNRMWISTENNGLFLYQSDEDGIQVIGANSMTGRGHLFISVTTTLLDRDGNLWVGTESNGLTVLNPETGQAFKHRRNEAVPLSLSRNHIRSLYQDQSGLIWVGTHGGGVNKILGLNSGFTLYRHDPQKMNSLSGLSIRAIHSEDNQSIWIGYSSHGLDLFNLENGKRHHFTAQQDQPNTLSDNRVRALLVDRRRQLWVGTENGLNLMNRETGNFHVFRPDPENPKGLRNGQVAALVEGDNNQIWVGTNGGGLHLLDTQDASFRHFPLGPSSEEAQTNAKIRALYRDPKGGLWIGTDGKGLYYMPQPGAPIQHYAYDSENPSSLSNNRIWCFLRIGHHIWIGTSGGLNLMDLNHTGTFERFSINDGLPNNVIYGMLTGKHGELWLSTNQGLSRMNIATQTFTNFTPSHGLQSSEFNQGAFFQSSDGTLFFGGIFGLNRFYPQNIHLSDYQPPILLTGLKKHNKEVQLPQHISLLPNLELSHKDSAFTLEFAAMDFTDPDRNTFAVMMENFDENWIEFTGKHDASYTNLFPGKYVFHVRGSNHDGTWNQKETRINIRVHPPFWLSKLAFTIYILLLSCLLYLPFRLQQIRREKERADAERLENLVQQRTTKLIETQQQLIDAAHMAGMAEIATEVLHNIGNAINSVNVSAFVIEKRVNYYFGSSIRLMNRFRNQNNGSLRAERLMDGIQKLAELMENAKQSLLEDIFKLHDQVNHIRNILTAQQSYADLAGHFELVEIEELIEDALKIESAFITKFAVKIERQFSYVPPTRLLKSKLVQVVCHLIKNACEAMSEVQGPRILTLTTTNTDDHIEIEIQDRGSGIAPDLQPQIFVHGFTTKPYGHGFGLHFCANAITEMKGTIVAMSLGKGKGTKVLIRLPLQATEPQS